MKAGDLGFEPLLDQSGEAYPPHELACYWLPHLWDGDATRGENRHARRVCLTECPALAACRQRRRGLGRDAEGVWGGVSSRRRRPAAEPEDPTIRHWREQFQIRPDAMKGHRQT